MPTSPRETLLCLYRYDPLDRSMDWAPDQQASIQRFYCKSRLATEIQGMTKCSLLQHDDQVLAQQRHMGDKVDTTLLATDQQRSVLNALDATQLHPRSYTPYGHHPFGNGLLSLLGFNGERPDPVTGHFHLGNGYRQFNPVLMRFNSPDSWSPFGEGGLNPYGYCGGEPINQSDPTGHFSFKSLNPLRWLRSSKAKAGTAVRTKSDMINSIIQQYNKPGQEISTIQITAKNYGSAYETFTERRYTIKNQFTTHDKNKITLHRTVEYNSYTLKTESPITIYKSLDSHSIGKPKIHNVEYNGPYSSHNLDAAKLANYEIQTRPMKFKKFDKITDKSSGTLARDLQDIREGT